MANITVTKTHKLSHKKAKEAAQKVADQLAEEYDLESYWEDDVLHFERSGVTGSLAVFKKEAQLKIKLGFFLSAFSSKIEAQVTTNMEKVFNGKA